MTSKGVGWGGGEGGCGGGGKGYPILELTI